ncbi:MAG: hypothetical protein Q8861_01155 [Bacteroidota bacterium]|nr:hypothetical protein [Bacteroidota bacterium]
MSLQGKSLACKFDVGWSHTPNRNLLCTLRRTRVAFSILRFPSPRSLNQVPAFWEYSSIDASVLGRSDRRKPKY